MLPIRRATAALVILAALAVPAGDLNARSRTDKLPPATRLQLDNGMELILIPNRAAPLATSVVVVRCGVIQETPATNGISHMLEHLLFNGTSRRTQAEIADEMDRRGIIANAHTDTSATSFFLLSARDDFPRALDLQSDMLFGSTIPEDKLLKERDIIKNEIAKDRASEETALNELFAQRLYHPHPLSLPVTGTPESIDGIGREALLAYYKRCYVPNNMTAIVMGDFDPRALEPSLRGAFGAAPPGLLPAVAPAAVNAASLGVTHTRRVEGPARFLALGAPAPAAGDESFPAGYILASLISTNLAADAAGYLPSGARGRFLDASATLDVHAGSSTLRVSASLDPQLSWSEARAALLQTVTQRCRSKGLGDEQTLEQLRLDEKASLMRLWEKPHYFGMDRARYIAAAGWPFARDLSRSLSWTEPGDLRDFARSYGEPSAWAVFEVGPDAPDDEGAASVAAPVPASTAQPTMTRESRDRVAQWRPKTAGADSPQAAPPPAARPIPSAPARIVLDNGLLLTVDFSDDSRVFAAHVMVKGRSALEPPGKTGIAELLHRLAGSGTRTHPGAELESALREIGGTLKVADDASIPYDDIYLSPSYSYVRLEALDEFAPQALKLLAEILWEPRFDDMASISAAREAALNRARMAAASPKERCRLLLARGLWGEENPLARSLFGSIESLDSITPQDLESFHKVYFSPRNVIVSVATSVGPQSLLPLLAKTLGRQQGGARMIASNEPAPVAAPSDPGPRRLSEVFESSQAYVMMGRALTADAALPRTAPPLAAVLSRRMTSVLREERGLAYSLSAESQTVRGAVVLQVQMGVLPDQVDRARAGLREMLTSIVERPPTQQEVDDAESAAEVRRLMRGLSRINRAFGRGLTELRREEGIAAWEDQSLAPEVGAAEVLAAARRFLEGGEFAGWVEAVVSPTATAATSRRLVGEDGQELAGPDRVAGDVVPGLQVVHGSSEP